MLLSAIVISVASVRVHPLSPGYNDIPDVQKVEASHIDKMEAGLFAKFTKVAFPGMAVDRAESCAAIMVGAGLRSRSLVM